MFEREVWVETEGRWRRERRRRSLSRRTRIWALGLPVCLALAAIAARGSIHPSPVGVGAPPAPSPSTGAIVFAFVPLLILWTSTVVAVRAIRRAVTPIEESTWLGIGAAAALTIALCGFVLYEAATPGCGEPRRNIIEPLPRDVEIVDEQMSGPTGGPENWRVLQLTSDEVTQVDLVEHLVATYRERGWPLEATTDEPGAFMRHGPEWRLKVRLPVPQQGERTDAVVVMLSHTPDDARGCHDL